MAPFSWACISTAWFPGSAELFLTNFNYFLPSFHLGQNLSLPIVISLLFLSFWLHHAFFIEILLTKHNLFLFPFPSCPSDIPLTTYLNDKFTRSPCPAASGSVRFCKPWGGLRYAPWFITFCWCYSAILSTCCGICAVVLWLENFQIPILDAFYLCDIFFLLRSPYSFPL